jgi:GntR family transcriptional regulator
MDAGQRVGYQLSNIQERGLNIEYPGELQRRFEQAVVQGECAKGEVVTVDDLATKFQAAPAEMMPVVLTAYRKGLVDRVAQEADAFRILGLPTTKFASVFTHTAKSGFKPRSLVRDVEVEPATAAVAEKLDVKADSPVYRYVRTRFADEQALANQTNYMPFAICPGLEQDDVSRYSFQKLLERKYSAVLVEMQERFEIVPANDQDLDILGLSPGSCILLIDRIALSATGWPLVWASIRIRPDRYQYVAALWPRAAELLER